MHKCSSAILYAACTFRPYKSIPVLKLFRTFTGKMARVLSLQMVESFPMDCALVKTHLPLARVFQPESLRSWIYGDKTDSVY